MLGNGVLLLWGVAHESLLLTKANEECADSGKQICGWGFSNKRFEPDQFTGSGLHSDLFAAQVARI